MKRPGKRVHYPRPSERVSHILRERAQDPLRLGARRVGRAEGYLIRKVVVDYSILVRRAQWPPPFRFGQVDLEATIDVPVIALSYPSTRLLITLLRETPPTCTYITHVYREEVNGLYTRDNRRSTIWSFKRKPSTKKTLSGASPHLVFAKAHHEHQVGLDCVEHAVEGQRGIN